MDESRYLQLAEDAFRRIEQALEPVDPDLADYERTQDVLQILFPPPTLPCIINTQRPTQQIWLAFDRKALHFGWDEASGRWLDDKGSGVELFSRVREILEKTAGVKIRL